MDGPRTMRTSSLAARFELTRRQCWGVGELVLTCACSLISTTAFKEWQLLIWAGDLTLHFIRSYGTVRWPDGDNKLGALWTDLVVVLLDGTLMLLQILFFAGVITDSDLAARTGASLERRIVPLVCTGLLTLLSIVLCHESFRRTKPVPATVTSATTTAGRVSHHQQAPPPVTSIPVLVTPALSLGSSVPPPLPSAATPAPAQSRVRLVLPPGVR